MQTFKVALAVAAAIVVGSSTASAQSVTLIDCGPSIGVTVGAAKNGDRNGASSGAVPDLSGTAEVPIADRWSARGEVGTAAWIFQKHDPWGVPLGRERARLTRFTLSAVRQAPMPCGAPVRVYGGFGLGAYRYGFHDQRVSVTRSGGHVLVGLEVRARDHIAFAADAAMHAARGPSRDPVFSYTLVVLQANVGLRLLF